MFLDYGETDESGEKVPRRTTGKKPGFDFTPSFIQTFGSGVKQSQLHPMIRKSVEEMQSQPAYIQWRRGLENARSSN